MHLRGWSRPLPTWVAWEVEAGRLRVVYVEKDNFDYLEGSVMSPEEVIVNYLPTRG